MADSAASKFQAVSPRRLTEEIADQIEHLILSGELKLGDVLPPERELATHLQVSRNILREAIKVLAQKGLLEVRPGSGTFVARPNADSLQDTLKYFVHFNNAAMFDLVEARRSLEVEIIGLAAERATPEDLDQIQQHYDEMKTANGNADTYVEADIAFHEALATAAKNEILQQLLKSIRDALRQNVAVLVKNHPSAVETAMLYHARIVKAVRDKDIEAARLAMREHIDAVDSALHDLEEQGIPLSQE